jgi:hypothetical protein
MLAVFLHPALVYPVTWIAQRSDLLLILTILVAMKLSMQGKSPLAAVFLSLLAKSPYLFHSVYFSTRQWQHGRKPAAVLMLLAATAVLLSGFLSLQWSETTSEGTLWAPFRQAGAVGHVLMLVARLAKIAEGVFSTLVPFPAFYRSFALQICLVVYPMVWLVVALMVVRNRPVTDPLARNLTYLGLLSAIPFAVTSELRATGPCVVFLLPGLLVAVTSHRVRATAAATLIAFNLWGSLLNYTLSDTGQYDLGAVRHFAPCGDEIPIQAWDCDRKSLLRRVLERYTGSPERPPGALRPGAL